MIGSQDAVADPTTGLISMKMYNQIAQLQWPTNGVDVFWRVDRTDYRIRVDGRFAAWRAIDAVTTSCSLNFCFGPDLPFGT